MSKLFRTLSLLVVLTLALTGCGSSQPAATPEATPVSDDTIVTGGRITVAVPFAPPNLDGDAITTQDVNDMMNHVYEGLFEVDASYVPMPQLASGYTMSDDGKTYIITLREGITFHDGSAMTSEDVIASLKRWFEMNGTGQDVAKSVVDYRANGDFEVQVSFDKPYAPFLSFLSANVSNSKLYIRPAELCQKYADEIMSEYIGTGPYKVSAFVPDQHLLLSRFDAYQQTGTPSSGLSGERIAYADEIDFQFVSEQAVRVAGVQSGQYQFAKEIPSDQYAVMSKDPQVQTIITSPSAQLLPILNQGSDLLSDVRLRQAINMAIDREEIGALAIGDPAFYHLNGCLFPTTSQWYDPQAGAGIYNSKDIAGAQALMDEAGYDGKPLVIMTQKENPIYAQTAIALESQLKDLGFHVDLQLLDNATVLEKRAQKQGWDILVNNFKSPDPDPQVYGGWMGTNKWIGNWDDEQSRQMDDIFARMLVETDPAKRKVIASEWYAYFYETVPYVKLVDFDALYLADKDLRDYANFTTPYYWNTWLAAE